MKKKLLKTFLLAAGLLVGGSAWGADELTPTLVTTLSSASSETPLYDAEATSWVINQGTFGGAGNNKSAGPMAFIKFDAASTLSGKLIQSAHLTFHAVCNDAGKNSTIYGAVMSTNWDETAVWNTQNTAEVLNPRTSVGDQNVGTSGADVSFDVTQSLIDDADKIIAFLLYTGTARSQTISNIKLVLELVDASTNAYYTVTYVDETDAVVKSSVKRVGANDAAIELLDSDKETFFKSSNTKKYTYVSDNSGEKTVASDGSTIVKVIFHDNVKYTYTVSNSFGTELASGEDWEGTSVTVPFNKYVLSGTTLYEARAIDDSQKQYSTTFTLDANKNITINYNYGTPIENVSFYTEGEDIASVTQVTNGTLQSRGSGQKGGAGTDLTVTTLTPGVYKIVACIGGKKDKSFVVKAGETEVINITTTATLTTYTSNYVRVTENTNVTFNGGVAAGQGSNSYGLDYIYVTKYNVNDNPEILGNVDYTTNYATVWNSTPVWINAGETGYYKIKNWNNTSSANLYENWYLFAANESSENLVIFGPNHSNTATNGTYTSKPTFTMADLNGATVELYFKLTNAGDGTYTWTTTAVTTKADGTKLTPNLVYTQTDINVSKLKAYVSVEKNWLEVLEQRENFVVSAPITSTTGYATFSSTYALDFTGISTLTAYKATACDGSTVTLEPITGTVAANTGLVIKGETTNIPVVATGEEATGNLLKPCDGSWTTLSKSDDGTNYVLSEQGDPKVAKFAPIGDASATLRAGVAYLYVPTTDGSRTLNIVFADEATAISAVQNSKEQSNEVYNLAGQRVAQPAKGLYIVNGKKVIMK